MNTQIQSYAFSARSPGPVTLFGYSSKSVPGLEINGMGKYGKILKEKIIYLTRSRQLSIPLNRYVISFEYDLDCDVKALRYLDLPILIMYWYLAGLIKMGRLDNCLISGTISPSGVIEEKMDKELIRIALEESWLLIGSSASENSVPSISIRELLGHIPQLTFSPMHKQFLTA